MRFRTLLALTLTWLFLLQPTQVAQSADDWSAVTDGIEFREFYLTGPKRAFVARMDRTRPNLVIDSMVAQGELDQGTETVSGMARRYDGTVVPWNGSWQQVGHVAVAINGIFYDPATGIPETGMIQSGWYIKRFDDLGGGSGFAWTGEREAFLGGCVSHPESKQVVTFMDSGAKLEIVELNTSQTRKGVTVFTPQYGPATPTDDSGVELLIEMQEPAGIVPLPRSAQGYIREVRSANGHTPIPFSYVVLSAAGGAGQQLRQYARVGGRVGISQEIQHLDRNCRGSEPWDWSRTFASIGGSFYFLNDRDIDEYPDNQGAVIRNPRTMVCFNDHYVYFVVVDGRQGGYSIGMTADEMGRFCRDTLDSDWGINQDGGGSSAMWVEGQLVNRPSDGTERPVANGLMMLVLEPAEISSELAVNQAVLTTRDTPVMLGPGDSYAPIATVMAGTKGIVVPDLARLNGVQVRGENWWKVAFDGVQGWVPEGSLHGEPSWVRRVREVLQTIQLEP